MIEVTDDKLINSLADERLVLTESKRPGRIRAASIAWGRFVAAKTSTPYTKIKMKQR